MKRAGLVLQELFAHPDGPALSVGDAALALGVHPALVRAAARDGVLEGELEGGSLRVLGIRRRGLLALLR